jgi:patatin-related protein
MKEKELRIALVCSGGVSLAIYIHGISAEILKLVRASAALHSMGDQVARATSSYGGVSDRNTEEFDSESIYYDLLREIGRTMDLRVVVDVIAGASAGGINATILARALSHDLSISGLRDLWFKRADVGELLAPEARAGDWSKWFVRPLVWLGRLAGFGELRDHELRSKLSLFLRSRWFEPPLDGQKLAGFIYDALIAMGGPRHPGASLLPPHHQLDLFVTTTDYHGCQQPVQIHDPPMICESEHRHLLHFSYRGDLIGGEGSDFDLANCAALAFAARATSSFPGAFPPAQITEIDALLAERSVSWTRRAHFIERNFDPYRRAEVDPTSVSFIDGSVLNNRPFCEAIAAIHDRPAYREVDRRLVFIDPDPSVAGMTAPRTPPGFFATLRGAWSDIPRAQPIADELRWVLEFNEQARRLKEIAEAARPQVSDHIAKVTGSWQGRGFTEEQVGEWRDLATIQAENGAGFAYDGYVRLKLASCRAFIARLIMDIRGVRPNSPFARAIAEVVEAWAVRTGTLYDAAATPAGRAAETTTPSPIPRWVQMLVAFDVDYRKRRLHFLIRGQNRLYQAVAATSWTLDAGAVDRLKRAFHASLDDLGQRERKPGLNASTRSLAAEVFPAGPSLDEAKDVVAYARGLDACNSRSVDRLVEQLATDIDLDSTTRDIDRLLAQIIGAGWPPESAYEVLVNYIGFPFFDVLTYPLLRWREPGEFDEILVDRVSAHDATLLRGFGTAQRVLGVDLEHFAAFLSRGYRENDYLIGRLHALDRLVDIVCNAAGAEAVRDLDPIGLKLRGFARILDAEEPHLPNCRTVIAELRSGFARMHTNHRGN